VQPVRPHHDPGPLDDRRAARRPAPDAGDPIAVEQQLFHGEALAKLGATLDGGVDEDRVEDGTADAELLLDPIHRRRRPPQHRAVQRHRHLPDRRAAGRGHPLQQSPPIEAGHTRQRQERRRHGVGGETRPVHEQDPVTELSEQHRQWRPGAAGAHHDHVVHGGGTQPA
jgi:hypothetical protein